MARIYKLSRSEVRFLQIFLNIPRLPFARGDEIPPEEALRGAFTSLTEKGYLTQDPQGGYALPDTLRFLFAVAGSPYGVFTMQHHTGRQEILLFLNDTVALVREDGDQITAMWLPALPMAIGHIANVSEPFLNPETAAPETHSPEALEALTVGLTEQGFRCHWTCTCVPGPGREEQTLCTVWATESEQVMLVHRDGQLILSRPRKVDYVNTLTRLIAPIHADAIRAGGFENGRV